MKKLKLIQVRVNPSVEIDVKKLARESGVSVSEIIRRAIAQYTKKNNAQS